MATLKSTLKIESTDLFPIPISFTKVNNNTIGAIYSTFTTVAVGTSSVTLSGVLAPLAGAYVYASAPITNPGNVLLSTAATAVVGSCFCQLTPGDVAFFPLGDGALTTDLSAIATLAGCSLDIFIGNR